MKKKLLLCGQLFAISSVYCSNNPIDPSEDSLPEKQSMFGELSDFDESTNSQSTQNELEKLASLKSNFISLESTVRKKIKSLDEELSFNPEILESENVDFLSKELLICPQIAFDLKELKQLDIDINKLIEETDTYVGEEEKDINKNTFSSFIEELYKSGLYERLNDIYNTQTNQYRRLKNLLSLEKDPHRIHVLNQYIFYTHRNWKNLNMVLEIFDEEFIRQKRG